MNESKINIITSKSNNSEIRRFFIDTTIDIVNIMTNKAMNGRIRDGKMRQSKFNRHWHICVYASKIDKNQKN